MERIDDLNINGLKLIQNTEYFLFGMDSVLLAGEVKTKNSDIVVDLGTGSAVIPILISAKNRLKGIMGIELQKEMFDLAKKNIDLNKLDDKICLINENLKNVKVIKEEIKMHYGREDVDIVVSNPPYKECGTGVLNDSNVKYKARHETLCSLKDIFVTASSVLKSRGKLYMVHKPERMADLICYGRKYNMEIKELRFLQPTSIKEPSLVFCTFVKDGGNECKVKKALIQYDDKGNYTEEILEIYK